jgi:hypothetical protein
MPPAESCNGLDDDCDGSTDEDFSCIQNREECVDWNTYRKCASDCSGWSSTDCNVGGANHCCSDGPGNVKCCTDGGCSTGCVSVM